MAETDFLSLPQVTIQETAILDVPCWFNGGSDFSFRRLSHLLYNILKMYCIPLPILDILLN